MRHCIHRSFIPFLLLRLSPSHLCGPHPTIVFASHHLLCHRLYKTTTFVKPFRPPSSTLSISANPSTTTCSLSLLCKSTVCRSLSVSHVLTLISYLHISLMNFSLPATWSVKGGENVVVRMEGGSEKVAWWWNRVSSWWWKVRKLWDRKKLDRKSRNYLSVSAEKPIMSLHFNGNPGFAPGVVFV